MTVLKIVSPRYQAPERCESATMTDKGFTLRSSYQQTRDTTVQPIRDVDLSIWRKSAPLVAQLEQVRLTTIPRRRDGKQHFAQIGLQGICAARCFISTRKCPLFRPTWLCLVDQSLLKRANTFTKPGVHCNNLHHLAPH